MQQRLLGSARRAGATFSGFSTPQKLIAGIGVAILLLGGFAFARWAGTPTMAPLFTNLASDDASAIVDQLDSQGVAYELTNGGQSVLVPRDDVYRLRLSMSSAGLPSSSDTGYALLDEQGVTSSQFQQQVTWQRALEGELSSTIGAIEGVEAAVVHLAIPQKDVFLDESEDPTASVLVETQPGQQIPGAQVQSIVHLVASSVEGLAPDAVTVVDGAGNLLSAAGVAGSAAGGMRDQQTLDHESRVAGALQAVLDRVVGQGNAVATVTADLDFDSTERTSETFTAAEDVPPLSSSSTTEEYTGGGAGAGAGGVLGPDNIAVPAGEGGESSYIKESVTANNAVNKITERTQEAGGTLRRQSVAVVVDVEAAGAVDMVQLTETISAAAGIDAERGDTLAVTRMPFDASAAEAATAALEQASEAAAAERTAGLIKTGAIAGAVLLALIIAFVASRRRRSKSEADHDIGELRLVDAHLELEAANARELDGVRQAALTPSPSGAGSAKQREDLTELVERQPAEVAELLRGWLADRRA